VKLLFDQNISFRIINKISAIFPSSKQVRELGLEDSSDKTIWNFAKENRFSIVTFDADFADIASVKDSPPKIIWLRTGNMTTENIAKLLNEHQVIIKKFHKNSEYQKIACLEIL
jgi:predicted nuclease of predicted toxin-antitoxin system